MLLFLRWLARMALALLCLIILYFNVKLFDVPDCSGNGKTNAEVLRQLHFLERAIHREKAGEAMQQIYPEGYVFIHVLYGLAWCEVAEWLDRQDPVRRKALGEISFCINALDAPEGKRVFNPDLPLEYGAFYRGWTAYLRGKFLSLAPPETRDLQQVARFREDCVAIAAAIGQTNQPYIESYRDAVWPADNIVCLAALALYDRIQQPRFQAPITEWLDRIRNTMQPEYGLIPHDYDLENSRSPGGVRGSSQSLMLLFLPEIDSTFAAEQYRNYCRHFLTYRLGLPGIREYPAGTSGSGDIDSGPVVLGIGGAATIVGVKTTQRFADCAIAVAMRNSVEALLLPQQSASEKTYVFGKLPILDAFMAWSNARICPCYSRQASAWRWQFQGISVVVLGLCGFLVLKMASKRRRQ